MICLLECEECTYTDETCHPNRLLLSLKWELASVSPFSKKKKRKRMEWVFLFSIFGEST